MKQSRTKIADVVASKALKQGVTKQLSQEIAAYLLAERRINELDSLLRDVQADWAQAGYIEVTARSSRPLSSTIKADITEQIKRLYPEAKHILITEVHDASIIGGARLSLPNQQLDMSIEAKLNKFKRKAAANGAF